MAQKPQSVQRQPLASQSPLWFVGTFCAKSGSWRGVNFAIVEPDACRMTHEENMDVAAVMGRIGNASPREVFFAGRNEPGKAVPEDELGRNIIKALQEGYSAHPLFGGLKMKKDPDRQGASFLEQIEARANLADGQRADFKRKESKEIAAIFRSDDSLAEQWGKVLKIMPKAQPTEWMKEEMAREAAGPDAIAPTSGSGLRALAGMIDQLGKKSHLALTPKKKRGRKPKSVLLAMAAAAAAQQAETQGAIGQESAPKAPTRAKAKA